MLTYSDANSAHVCNQCGVEFIYPAGSRSYGSATGVELVRRWWWPFSHRLVWTYPGIGEPCCPCEDCDPELWRECIAEDCQVDVTFTEMETPR